MERDQSEPEEYLTAEGDPVLAELWDNEEDAIYDDMYPRAGVCTNLQSSPNRYREFSGG